MNGQRRAISAVLVGVGLAALALACSLPAAPGRTPGADATAAAMEAERTREERIALAEQAIRNGSFELPGMGQFQLQDGSYQQKYGEGASQVKRAGVATVAFGDLDGDGSEDAAAVLWTNTGGAGSFIYLTPVLHRAGSIEQAGAQLLGDRVEVRSLKVESGTIRVEVLTQDARDPMTSPSQVSEQAYALSGGTLARVTPPQPPLPRQGDALAQDPRNASYTINGKPVQLTDGLSETEAAPGSASRIVTRFFGNEVRRDLDGDGDEDVAFLLTQQTGGSGTFFYLVAALRNPDGYAGSHALLIGDRVAPQTTEPGPGRSIVVNYADRRPGEPMTAQPSEGKSLRLLLNPRTLQFGELP